PFIHDRVAHATTFELRQPPGVTETAESDVRAVLKSQINAAAGLHRQFETDLQDWRAEGVVPSKYRVFAHTVNHYDGQEYKGLAMGKVGRRGALTLSETLV